MGKGFAFEGSPANLTKPCPYWGRLALIKASECRKHWEPPGKFGRLAKNAKREAGNIPTSLVSGDALGTLIFELTY